MPHQIKKQLGVTCYRHSAFFRVWAPFAQRVELSGTFSEHRITLESEQDGYWSTEVEGAKPGHMYKYHLTTLDGDELERNDPRARAITSSDKGFSVIVGNDFDWTDEGFIPASREHQIIYEMHVGTFNRVDPATPGTFDSAIERLDYLKELGVTMIELMPVTSMAFSNGWGYAPNYIYSVESMLGGRHGLMKFVNACHNRGIGVILDVVYNHFYPDTDLWQFDGWHENNRGGIYFYNDERGDTPWGGRPDYGRAEVRQFILDNIVMWINEYHIDGLRIDSTIYMRNTEGKDNNPSFDIGDAWQLLSDITETAKKIKPYSILIAEDAASNDFITKSSAENGCGFDAQWELGFPHAIRQGLGLSDSPQNLDFLITELERTYNGDAYARIIFADSHDTAANGSVRLNEAVSPNRSSDRDARQKSLLAATITMTSPGVPMILQGAEFLQAGAFNDWQELQWENTSKFSGIVDAHKHLIHLRQNRYRNTVGLTGEGVEILHHDTTNNVITYRRYTNHKPEDDVVVIANFSDKHFSTYDARFPRNSKWTVRFNSTWKGYSADFPEVTLPTLNVDNNCVATIELAPYSAYILSEEK